MAARSSAPSSESVCRIDRPRSPVHESVIEGLLLLAAGAGAGLFGSLLGLGGGILIVPLLTLAFGLPLLTAVGIRLIYVIVTSGAAGGVYLQPPGRDPG